ncbi:hypothetical protein EK904_003727, partial [Melospiza melodia maxima]
MHSRPSHAKTQLQKAEEYLVRLWHGQPPTKCVCLPASAALIGSGWRRRAAPAGDLWAWPRQAVSRRARVGAPSCCPDISSLTPAELLGLARNFMKMNGMQRVVIGERFQYDSMYSEQLDVCKATWLSCKRENFADGSQAERTILVLTGEDFSWLQKLCTPRLFTARCGDTLQSAKIGGFVQKLMLQHDYFSCGHMDNQKKDVETNFGVTSIMSALCLLQFDIR